MAKFLGKPQAAVGLRRRVLEAAEKFRRAHAPLTPERMAKAIGVDIELTRLSGDGMLDPSGKRVLISRDQPPRRQRFTLAHEVVHFLIRSDDELLSELHEWYQGEDLEAELESLCNVGAAEMLLPREIVAARLSKRGVAPRLVPDLAESHQVSEEVAAIALAERSSTPLMIVIAGAKPLRVFFSARSSGFRAQLPRGKMIEREHPLSIVYDTGLDYSGQATLPGGFRVYSLEAYPRAGRVYALFREMPS